MTQSTSKSIITLVDDVYDLFKDGKEFSDESVRSLSDQLATTIKERFSVENRAKNSKPYLRPSNLGRPNRQLWFEIKGRDDYRPPSPRSMMNFLFGDIWEDILLFLCEEAGHEVTGRQRRVNVDGVKGSMDAEIDGIIVDVKTAFGANFEKFSKGKLFEPDNDPYGYIAQASLYSQAHGPEVEFAFLATNKTGDMAMLPVDPLMQIDVRKRIKEAREVLASDTPPEEKCYDPQAYGQSGNIVLHKNCQNCPAKLKCWEGLRAFKYSNHIKYFTHVEKEPSVEEISL